MSVEKNKNCINLLNHAATRRHRGFTLIELMVVLLIIGLLAGLIGLEVLSRIEEAKIITARADIAKLREAVNMFYRDNGTLPDNLEDLVVPPADLTGWKKCLDEDRVPDDPWGNEYKYEPVEKREFLIYSLGADGEEGGEEEDADIGLGGQRTIHLQGHVGFCVR